MPECCEEGPHKSKEPKSKAKRSGAEEQSNYCEEWLMVVVRLWSSWNNFVSREEQTTSSDHNRCACVAITIAVTIAITIAYAFGSDHNRCGPCAMYNGDSINVVYLGGHPQRF